ncbi:hypothetical protein BC835DRAFT_1313356 [Cytidiella melzeri]|nr:hypothetical protein BC835DRAFT_1313356 [Cytidiella melzeri]
MSTSQCDRPLHPLHTRTSVHLASTSAPRPCPAAKSGRFCFPSPCMPTNSPASSPGKASCLSAVELPAACQSSSSSSASPSCAPFRSYVKHGPIP